MVKPAQAAIASKAQAAATIHFGRKYFGVVAKIIQIPGLFSIQLNEVSSLNSAYYAAMTSYRKHKWRNPNHFSSGFSLSRLSVFGSAIGAIKREGSNLASPLP
jgi:hypothetical protein